MSTKHRIAMVGAGIAGITCARNLVEKGFAVSIFDKGRRLGGRASTRDTAGFGSFDHGAQYFTVRDRRFESVVTQAIRANAVKPWDGRIVVLENSSVQRESNSETRYVGTPGMRHFCQYLAEGLPIDQSVRVRHVERTAAGWELFDDGQGSLGEFELVLIAIPPEQAAELVGETSSIGKRLGSVNMRPCWAGMYAFETPVDVPFDAAFVLDEGLSWVSRDSSKPDRDRTQDRWILHASPEWSTEHLERPSEEVARLLLEMFAQVLANKLPTPVYSTAHRWRYALADDPLTTGFLFDASLGQGICGDWIHGSRVEGAFLSGYELAEAAIELLRQ